MKIINKFIYNKIFIYVDTCSKCNHLIASHEYTYQLNNGYHVCYKQKRIEKKKKKKKKLKKLIFFFFYSILFYFIFYLLLIFKYSFFMIHSFK